MKGALPKLDPGRLSPTLCTDSRPLYRRRERFDVAGTHHREVAVIHGRDLGHLEALGQRDDAGVGAAEREVGVGLDELRGSLQVGGLDVKRGQEATGERPQKRGLRPGTDLSGEQVADLGDNRTRHQARRPGRP